MTTTKTTISLSQAQKLLEKIKEDDLDQIQKRTLDYLKLFSKQDAENIEKVQKQLIEDCELNENEAIELLNISPHTLEELRTFTSGWKKLLSTEILEKILAILKETTKR